MSEPTSPRDAITLRAVALAIHADDGATALVQAEADISALRAHGYTLVPVSDGIPISRRHGNTFLHDPVRVVKLTVNLPEEALVALKDMAQKSGTVTQAVKDAIALKRYIDQQKADGARVIIERRNGDRRQLV